MKIQNHWVQVQSSVDKEKSIRKSHGAGNLRQAKNYDNANYID